MCVCIYLDEFVLCLCTQAHFCVALSQLFVENKWFLLDLLLTASSVLNNVLKDFILSLQTPVCTTMKLI